MPYIERDMGWYDVKMNEGHFGEEDLAGQEKTDKPQVPLTTGSQIFTKSNQNDMLESGTGSGHINNCIK